MLYLVPTPIGNLEDITLRALRILKESDLILAEDTRTSGKMLKHFGIVTPCRSHHAHNEHGTIPRIIEELQNGSQIALISDAGTPGISDPGFLLVRECIRNGIEVQCLPGPTAFVPALVASGLPCDRFHFEGFLPQKKGRKSRLVVLSDLPATFVLYESPFRLQKCLKQLMEHCGPDRPASVSRELTKIYEETIRGTLESVFSYYSDKTVKGEIVICVGGKSDS